MAEVPLTHGQVAIIDDDDLPKIGHRKWHAARRRGRSWYARCNLKVDGTNASIYMQELLIDRPTGMVIDHIDGNGLNNRKSNLRILAHEQNLWNRPHDKGKIVGVKRYGSTWRASISHRGAKVELGFYPTTEQAASARDFAARILRGQLAHTNLTQPVDFDLFRIPDAAWGTLKEAGQR